MCITLPTNKLLLVQKQYGFQANREQGEVTDSQAPPSSKSLYVLLT